MRLTETAILSLRRQFADVYGIDNVRAALDTIEAQDSDAAADLISAAAEASETFGDDALEEWAAGHRAATLAPQELEHDGRSGIIRPAKEDNGEPRN